MSMQLLLNQHMPTPPRSDKRLTTEVFVSSDGTIPKFTSIPMPIPIKCSISIPILDSSYNISCGG